MDIPAAILLVDDDVDFVDMNSHLLERAGYRVLRAYDSTQALAKLAAEPVDLVITDLMMTSMDAGFSLARHIRNHSQYAGVGIILATSVTSAMGYDFRPHGEQDLAAMNVDAYFDKPIPPAALLAKVAELLAKKQSRNP